MPHQVHERKFSRETAHRMGMLRNLTLSVLRYERVKTTEAKAKEVRGFVDKMINLGKDGSLASRRRARAFLPESEIVEKVFDDLAGRFPTRVSGYTRTVRLGPRVGDNAPMMLIELMPGVDEEKATADKAEADLKPRRRLGIRRRASAEAAGEEGKTTTRAKKTAAKSTAKTSARAREKA